MDIPDVGHHATCDDGPVSTSALPTPPLARRRSGRFVAGVAGGISDHLGVNVLWVRLAFVVLTVIDGAGVLAYALLWMFVRQERGDIARVPGRVERQQALGLVALGLGAGLATAAMGNTVGGWIVGPLGVVAVGAAVVWREADETQRAAIAERASTQRRRWTAGARSGVAGGGGRAAVLRVLAGAVFVATGIGLFLVGNLELGQVQFALLAVLATLLGVGVITVPWWVKLVRDLGEERRSRIVEVERADIAAHLHDSVLQTLALIQRNASSQREVTRLARGQERELRSILYDTPETSGQFGEQVRSAAAEVEDAYAMSVEVVVVGDAPLDDRLRAVAAAAREALVNAAKHSGVTDVSLYAEIEPEEVSVFVKDRGVGFDADDVAADRQGVRGSIVGRIERHGGNVTLTTAKDAGTEVEIRMPREESS